MKERAVQFGEAASLVGVVSGVACASEGKPGVILLNPGIVHRVGPGRIYVKIARALAAQGFTVFRFDFSGIGDSLVRLDNLPFEESSVEETRSAMSFLQATRGIDHFILLGGCSGATVSLETASLDRRVIGTILINFPAKAHEEEETMGRNDDHYYWNFALVSGKSWRKLFTGQSDYRRIYRALVQGMKRKFARGESTSGSDQQFRAKLRELASRGVQLTFICSKGDPLLRDLREAGGGDLKRLCAQEKVECEIIARSDHTFSSLYDQERLVDAILKRAYAAARGREQYVQVPEIASSPAQALRPRRQSIS